MISGICISNRDSLRNVDWPMYFVNVPQRGDLIKAVGKHIRAQVTSITHCVEGRDKPYIEIYLEEISR